MEKIKVGEIVGVVGIRGEFKVYDFGEEPARYGKFGYIYIESEKYDIEKARVQKNVVVLQVNGISDRNDAEKLRGKSLYIDEGQLPKLPEGTYYIKDLIGFDIVGEDGEKIGELKDILKNTAQPLYVIEKKDGTAGYIPGVDEFILYTDTEKREIKVKVLEGLLD